MDLRLIPSIEQLRQRPAMRGLEERYGRAATVDALREEVETLRVRAVESADQAPAPPATKEDVARYLEHAVALRLTAAFAPSLRPVINATGVIIHTNLGRAPLSRRAIERIADVAPRFSTLEYDLSTGTRGSRNVHGDALLSRLTGAEASVVVNNNAAATMLILAALAAGREVIVSRGELVEIGGGFRVPDVMQQSGAILREVGTTNKTRVGDYEGAINDRTALILRVHRSNFRIEGFTEQPTLEELAALGQRRSIPVVEDLGSGYLGGSTSLNEPTVHASVAAGMDIVCFSGDKLLGGPQAGIIVGRLPLIDRIRRHPLMRALRVDKLVYAALEATLLDYLAGRAEETVPVARMLALSPERIRERAEAIVATLGGAPASNIEIRDGMSMVGGGSAPGVGIPTCLIAIKPKNCSASEFEQALRRAEPPVIARIEEDNVVLDLRTVASSEDETMAQVIQKVINGA